MARKKKATHFFEWEETGDLEYQKRKGKYTGLVRSIHGGRWWVDISVLNQN